jgi:hypothetical protein
VKSEKLEAQSEAFKQFKANYDNHKNEKVNQQLDHIQCIA